eukprot:15159-Heterococcus_DN1.PRE.2
MSFTFSVSPGLLPSAMLQILYARVLSSLLTCIGQYARQHRCMISTKQRECRAQATCYDRQAASWRWQCRTDELVPMLIMLSHAASNGILCYD